MKAFVDAIKKKKQYLHPLNDELKILKILDAIEQSNKNRKKITLNR